MAASNAAFKITADSELMKNQKHAILMGAQQDFQVLQTADGDAVFFSIGSDGVFYLTRELRKSDSGWNQTDLSSSLNGNGKAKWFASSQNPRTLAIDVALVMSVDGKDSLYLSRNNLIDYAGWEESVSWQSVDFDDNHSSAPSPLVIAGLYMLTRESMGEEPGPITWFVDIVKDPSSTLRLLDRYYIQPDSSPKWHKHTLPNDVQEGSISSCLGRRHDDYVDGIYTMGRIGESDSLIFTPTKNVWKPRSPPQSTVLGYPKGTSGISSCVGKGGLTKLFASGDEGLHLFEPDGQGNCAEPIQVIPSSPTFKTNTFAGATSLKSATVNSKTAVWGLNRHQDLVYTTCPTGNEAEPSSWSPPMRICSGVLQFAFYLNMKSSFNVLFALLRDQSMMQFVQDAATGIWTPRSIALPVIDVSRVIEDNTFTTHVKCTDSNGMPAIEAPIRIESMQTVPLLVNHSYYKISPGSPIDIKSDGTGSVTIIQETDSLSAVCFRLVCDDQILEVDPQSKIVKKLSNVKSGSDLNVQIPDSNGKTRPLVPDDVPLANREHIARFSSKLLEVRSSLPKYGPQHTNLSASARRSTGAVEVFGVIKSSGQLKFCEGHNAHATLSGQISAVNHATMTSSNLSTSSVPDLVTTAAGDIFQSLTDEWENVQSLWAEVTDNIAHFFVQVSNTIYTAILDTVEVVSSAIEFVFKQIKVFFEDLVAWLGFVFNWSDIIRTHKVIKNVAKQYAWDAVDQIDALRAHLENGFGELRNFIDGESWDNADLPTDVIGEIQNGKYNRVPAGNSPQSNWAAHHTNNGLRSASAATAGSLPGVDMSSSVMGLLETLQKAVKNEEQVLKSAVNQIQAQIVDDICNLSPITLIQKVLRILGGFVVDTAKNILLTLVDLMRSFMSGLLDLLDTPLEIPIISPMYKLITGGDELSCLDVICLIAAIPATLVYKIVTQEVPFPDNDSTRSLINASSFSQLRSLLSSTTLGAPALSAASLTTTKYPSEASAKASRPLVKTVVAVLKICNIAVGSISAGLSYFKRETGLSGPKITALSFSLFLAAASPTIAANFGEINKWTIVANALLTLGLGKLCLESSDLLNETLKFFVMPWVSTLLGLVGLVVTIWARCEQKNAKTSDEVGLVGGIFSNIGKTLTAFTSNRMFPEFGALFFGLSIGCAIVGSHFSAGSGVCVLNVP
jgi:hypothetical protein